MKKLRLFDSLKFVRFVVAAIVCIFILNVAHAATTAIQSVIAYGKTEQSATPTPTNPVPIMTNNGVLKVNKNLLNPATVGVGFIKENGTLSTSSDSGHSSSRYSDLIPVVKGLSYTFSGNASVGKKRVHGYDANSNWVQMLNEKGVSSQTRYILTTAIPNNVKFIRVSYSSSDTDVKVMEGTSADEVYVDGLTETIRDSAGHTATAQMLLGINDTYRDEQNINTGAITRRVGVKVLDGTENWITSTTYGADVFTVSGFLPDSLRINANSGSILFSTHFAPAPVSGASSNPKVNNTMSINSTYHAEGVVWIRSNNFSTVAQFKSWLAEQYANGTPVIVVYPLNASAQTTESVATQQMTTAPVRQTAGSILGMPIEVVLGDGTREWVRDMITIATTRYNEQQFAPVESRLDAAVAAVDTVVSQTMSQAQAIDTIATSKQTRPDEGCTAKYCLLIEDENGTPHWYPIAGANGVEYVLPSGYTELQYLQTDGDSWIDTGIKGDMSYKYEIDFQQLDAGQYRNWGAFDQSAYAGGPNMSFTYSSGFAVRWTVSGSSNQLVDHLSSLDSNRHHIIIDNGYITWDGVNKGRSTGHQDNYVFRYNLFLGTVNPGGNTPTSNAKSKYYSYKVWNTSGELIQNFIPARRDSDGVLGMYDLADANPATAFYTNAGTGTFVAGPDM